MEIEAPAHKRSKIRCIARTDEEWSPRQDAEAGLGGRLGNRGGFSLGKRSHTPNQARQSSAGTDVLSMLGRTGASVSPTGSAESPPSSGREPPKQRPTTSQRARRTAAARILKVTPRGPQGQGIQIAVRLAAPTDGGSKAISPQTGIAVQALLEKQKPRWCRKGQVFRKRQHPMATKPKPQVSSVAGSGISPGGGGGEYSMKDSVKFNQSPVGFHVPGNSGSGVG